MLLGETIGANKYDKICYLLEEVETVIAVWFCGMHGTNYKRIVGIHLAVIAAYLFKTAPAAVEGCDRAPLKSNTAR
ncbi:hypothetical protein [Coleofasciculus sp. FACHB-712]|uniref:hypothetical protein n=1 Tax=Coleofasciculus sp. FACHB-712 TaxID=2692789 RepID=UPI001688F2EE|nr:hypothetical protein [Coleofasciculus sp. FACHB-712]